MGIDFALGFGYEYAPPSSPLITFLDVLRPPPQLGVNVGENWPAHWLQLLRDALHSQAGNHGEQLLAEQLDHVLAQYAQVDPATIVQQLTTGAASPAGETGSITAEQEQYAALVASVQGPARMVVGPPDGRRSRHLGREDDALIPSSYRRGRGDGKGGSQGLIVRPTSPWMESWAFPHSYLHWTPPP